MVHEERQVNVNCNLTQINSGVHKLQSKTKSKTITVRATNYACFKLEEKTTKSDKENKNSFINVLGDNLLVLDKEN